jgi:hypothetical protein
VVTSDFTRLAITTAKSYGVPDLPRMDVAHPIGGIAGEEVREKARRAIEGLLAQAAVTSSPSSDVTQWSQRVLQVPGASSAVTQLFYKNGWTDGLPFVPPTQDAVTEMLRGTDLRPSHSLGLMAPSNAATTIEKIAINAVMAGCRPTYMPILIAAIEGLLEVDFDLPGVQTSTGAHSPMLLINGPVRGQINVNCSSGALGHGWQANATIGRAIRLVLNNIGGAIIGSTDMTTLGTASNFTYCMGENEEESPWGPFHVEQGFSKEDSAVSVLGAFAPEHVSDHVGIAPEEILAVVADNAAKITRFHVPMMDHIIPRDTFLVLGPEHAQSIAKAGWSKRDVQQFVFERAVIPYETLTALRRHIDPTKLVDTPKGKGVPMFARPDCLKVIVVGGPGKHSAYINSGHTKRVFTKKVVLPKDWASLVDRYRE